MEGHRQFIHLFYGLRGSFKDNGIDHIFLVGIDFRYGMDDHACSHPFDHSRCGYIYLRRGSEGYAGMLLNISNYRGVNKDVPYLLTGRLSGTSQVKKSMQSEAWCEEILNLLGTPAMFLSSDCFPRRN